MALTVSDVTTATSTSAGATLDVTGITAAVGDWLVLACSADNAGTSGASSTSASITDAAGNTWTRQSEVNRTEASASDDGATLSIWTAHITNALSSATITINFSPNTTAKAAVLNKVVADSGEVVTFIAAGAGVTGSATTFNAGGVTVNSGQAILGFTAVETSNAVTGDPDTTNGSWSTIQTAVANAGTTTTSQRCSGQWKVATGTGTQTYNSSVSSARDYAINYIILEAGTAVAVEPGTGAAEVEGFAPDAGPSATIESATGEIEIEGFAPSWLASVNIMAGGAGAIRLRGFRPTVEPSNVRWPPMLPVPLLATHAFQPRPSMLRTEMEMGAARQRRLSRVTPNEAPFSLVVDQGQMAMLEGWVDDIADYGGEYFAIELETATGYRTHTVRLMGEIDYKQIRKDRWLATGTFEMQERPMLSEAELDALLGDLS